MPKVVTGHLLEIGTMVDYAKKDYPTLVVLTNFMKLSPAKVEPGWLIRLEER